MRFFCWIFLCGTLAADEPLFVSLGAHCEAAIQLRDHKFRSGAYPFDWLITLNHEKLIALLNEDFQFFLDERCFFQDPDHPTVVENSHYQIEFRHEWPFSDLRVDSFRYEKQLQTIREKYSRRLARFRAIRDYRGPVFFFRVAYDFQNGGENYWWDGKYLPTNAMQAAELRDALKCYFPDTNFTLILINYIEDHLPAIVDIPGVIEFKIRKADKFEDYQDLLHALY